MTISKELATRIEVASEFLSFKEVARRYKVSRNTVRKYAKKGGEHRTYKKRPTSKRVADRRRKILRLIDIRKRDAKGEREHAPFGMARTIQAELQRRYSIRPSLQTIRSDMRATKCLSRVRKPVPTRDRKDLDQARVWKKEMLRRGVPRNRRHMMFSDETWISTVERTGRYQYVRPGKKPCTRERKNRRNYPSRQAWAAIWVGGRSKCPVIFPKWRKNDDGEDDRKKGFTLTQQGYRTRCLGTVSGVLKEQKRMYFLQDGAKCHTAKGTEKYFKKLLGDSLARLVQLPPYAPQCNPIEHVWADWHERIGRKAPTNEEELIKAAKEAWDEIPQDYIDACCLGWKSAVENLNTKV